MKNKILFAPLLRIACGAAAAFALNSRAQFDGGRPGTVTPPGGSPPQNVNLVSGVPASGLLLSAGSIKMSDAGTNLLAGYSTNTWATWFCDTAGNKRILLKQNGDFSLKDTNNNPLIYFEQNGGHGPSFGILSPPVAGNAHSAQIGADNGQIVMFADGVKAFNADTNCFPISDYSGNLNIRYPYSLTGREDPVNFIMNEASSGLVKFRDTNGIERLWWSPHLTGFKTPDGNVALALETGRATFNSTLNVNGDLAVYNNITAGGSLSADSLSVGTLTIGTLSIEEAATVGSTLGVSGATTLGSTLGVNGLITGGGISTGSGLHSGNGAGLTNTSAAFSTNASTSITANGSIYLTNATTGRIFKLLAQQIN